MFKNSTNNKKAVAKRAAITENKATIVESESIINSEAAITENEPPVAPALTRTHQDFIEMFDQIVEGKMRNQISTGYAELDNILGGGLNEGLYTVMAVPGAGKTTLCLSMLPHLTAAGHHVIFISLEMSKHQILTKCASRLTHSLYGIDHARTYQEICQMNEDDRETIDTSVAAYEEEASHTSIITSSQIESVDSVEALVARCCDATDKPPVLIIDYLQLMAAMNESASEKQAADYVVTRLRNMALAYHIPVLLISSVARTSYDKKLTIGSAKESGGIEYTSDAMLGLEYATQDKNSTPCPDNSRLVSLKVFKNRFGPTDTTIRLRMLPQYSVFCSEEPAKYI